MRDADKHIREILASFDEDFASETWVVPGGKARAIYHRTTERMAVKAGVTFDPPQVISCALDNAVIVVTGRRGDRVEWSIGEASPKNNRNAYPLSMAEKRGKDRVALKLIGLHGLVYSEDELDGQPAEAASLPAFVTARPNGAEPTGPSAYAARKNGEWEPIRESIWLCGTSEALLVWPLSADFTRVPASWREHAREEWGKALAERLAEECHKPSEVKQWGVDFAKPLEKLLPEWVNAAREVCTEHLRALRSAQPQDAA